MTAPHSKATWNIRAGESGPAEEDQSNGTSGSGSGSGSGG